MATEVTRSTRPTEEGAMFDVDELVAACRAAIAEPEPRLAVRDVLERTVADPAALLAHCRPPGPGS